MRFPRSLISLLCALCLAAAPSAALAQSAGDEQYQDPFGAETQTGSSSQQEPPTTEEPDPGSTLTDEPQSDGGPVVTPDITEPPDIGDLEDVPQDTTNRPQRLANTGLDTRLFLVLGGSLLLAGIGLRLRTIPERF